MISKCLSLIQSSLESDLYSHCPWIYNCVGANNLRHFVLYIMSMEVGIVLFIRLVLYRK